MYESWYTFLFGALTALAGTSGLFFLRYRKASGDRFFAFFAVAFASLGVHWGLMVGRAPEDEYLPYFYVLRLFAFLLIVGAIIDKNRRSSHSESARRNRHGVSWATADRPKTPRCPSRAMVARRLYRGSRMTNRLASVAREPELAIVSISPQTETALTYVRGALFNPVSLSVMAFAVCVGVGYAGMLGALIAMLAFVALGSTATRYKFVRHQLDKQFEYRQRQKREAERMKQLKPTGPIRQQQYCDLRDLVADIEKTDASEATRFELQSLLDHFVTLAVSHQKCLDSLRLAGSSDLPRALPLPDPNRSIRRREIMARRLRHRDECVRRIERLADELEAVDELVRLVAQRVACPQLDGELDREIERRLWELDEVDAALSQLSA